MDAFDSPGGVRVESEQEAEDASIADVQAEIDSLAAARRAARAEPVAAAASAGARQQVQRLPDRMLWTMRPCPSGDALTTGDALSSGDALHTGFQRATSSIANGYNLPAPIVLPAPRLPPTAMQPKSSPLTETNGARTASDSKDLLFAQGVDSADYPLISSDATLDRFRLRLVQSRLNRPTNFDQQPEVHFEKRVVQPDAGGVHGEDVIDGVLAVNEDLREALDVLRKLFKLLVYDYNEHWTSKMQVNWLLQQCLRMPTGSLISFKLLVASASCGRPRPVLAHGVWRSEEHRQAEDVKLALFPSLIALVLDSVALYDSLIGSNHCNIYRVAFMMQCGSPVLNRKALGYAGFTAVLQITMVVYVSMYTAQQINEPDSGRDGSESAWLNSNMPLAVLLFIFSMFIVYQGPLNGVSLLHRNRFWTKSGGASHSPVCLLYRAIDLISNAVVPVALLFVGFVLICTSETLMDAVLNSVALLFIPEIDDQLPALIGIPVDDVVMKHITSTIFPELCGYVLRRKKALADPGNDSAPPATASTRLHDVLLAGVGIGEAIPRQLRRGHDEIAVDISPVGYLTAQCLFRRLDAVRRPRMSDIVWLRLWPMDGGAPIVFGSHARFGDFVHLQKPAVLQESEPTFWPQPVQPSPTDDPVAQSFERLTLEGALIVTDIGASAVITRLRVCHAASGPRMMEGISYYKLFECDSSAERLLSEHASYGEWA